MLDNAHPPRGPRGASSNVRAAGRGTGRGGVQKRRGGNNGPARVDRDGDLVMDAAAGGDSRRSGSGRGRINAQPSSRPLNQGRPNSGPTRGGNTRAQQAILRGIRAHGANILESRITTANVTLKVDGLSSSKAASNPDGGLDALLGFLERKASSLDSKSNRAVRITKSFREGDSVIIKASPEDIERISKLNGFSFAGASLTITNCDPISRDKKKGEKGEVSEEAQELKRKFTLVLSQRYDDENKLLNLSMLGSDTILQEMGLFSGQTNPTKVFPALMAVAADIFKGRNHKNDAVVSVTLTDNGITNVDEVTTLTQTFPHLKNIDLSRNSIADIKALQAWRTRLRKLENLILADNPIESQLADLQDEFLRRYPHLQKLNNVVVRSLEQVAAIEAIAAAAQCPIPTGPADFRDTAGVGENFVRQFFQLIDTDRTTFLNTYYDKESKFSLNINMTAPRDTDVPVHPWADYTKHSRNLTKLDHLSAKMNRLHVGSQSIEKVWSQLPATRHPSIATDLDKYIIECKPLPGLPDPTGQAPMGVDGLMVTIHGEFEEPTKSTADNKVLRSFSRNFILGPGSPGGPVIRVIQDMLSLRAWGTLPKPEMNMTDSVPQQSTAPAVEPALSEEQQKETLARQLMEASGMTLEYSVLCLNETSWDIEAAFMAFTNNKDKLPPNAFIANAAL